VNIHGGPTGQTQVVFTGRFGYWLDRGWAVLAPDHRGSTGWGRAYTQALAGGWGDLDVEDVAAGIRHAVAAGWCDARRVVVMGGSSGGFTVLGLLARHPELCAAGVDLSGPTDLLDLDETTHRYERHYLHSIVGPLPATVERYSDRSPVNFAERITAPLLILQGADDRVVPVSQSRAIADRLQRLGRPVELHVYEGEGHGWSRPETVIDELERTEDFLRRHVLRWRP
jgi:dipeptidyl aminopeptidase/acylaminoacyl peptidase